MTEFKTIDSIEESAFIHNLYVSTGEPDAPKRKFEDESEKVKARIFERCMRFARLFLYQGEIVGFVFFNQLEDGINIGGALTSKVRGRGLGGKLISGAISIVKKENPDRNIFASTRAGNLAAISSLKKAGFVFQQEEIKPPIQGQVKELRYLRFMYQGI